jgi:hypothetical protein
MDGRELTSKHGVQDDTNGEKETSGSSRHTAKGTGHGATSGQQHGRDKDVCHQAKDEKDNVGDDAISGFDDFEKGVSIWRAAFQSRWRSAAAWAIMVMAAHSMASVAKSKI